MEGASNFRPPYFDGSDYALWKTKMKNHLISQGFRVWRSVLYGYEEPTIEDATTKSTSKSSTGIAFKSAHEDSSETCEDDSLSDEELAKFAKKFKKFFRRRNDLGKSYKPSSNLKRNTLGNDDKRQSFDKSRKPQGIQCHECHGFGHIQSECANTFKEKMKNGLKVTWDDDSGDDGSESGFQIGGEWNSSASVLVATVDPPISPKLLGAPSPVHHSRRSRDTCLACAPLSFILATPVPFLLLVAAADPNSLAPFLAC
ncbi:hypothetical protein RHGRI_020586 [Rhododendron griersonianum]|uniref:DUF4219 domain-containing protein n=1 Tax=Rhododendron griersonianum TaxID=479676 RepID=A0AAV6JGW2_9ERIC|nr:hypothetical protein RHGRI_020586 [Rhododendron griersonianum]